MPEAAVAHDGDRPARQVGPDRGRARQRHAVAEDRVAEAERREGRERMAADIGADMGRAELALHQLDRGEYRPLRTAGAEGRRPRRQRRRRGGARRLVGEHRSRARGDRFGSSPAAAPRAKKPASPRDQHLGLVFAGLRQQALAVHAGLQVGAAQLDIDLLLDVIG